MGHHLFVAERTGLEPATSCVTGRRSNQLNYRSAQSLAILYDSGLFVNKIFQGLIFWSLFG